MARETKAQREAREAAEYQAQWNKVVAEWPARFAQLMFNYATLPGFSLEANANGTYGFLPSEEVCSWADLNWLPVSVTAEQNWEVFYTLQRAEQWVDEYAAMRNEAARKAQVKRDALAKLNSEERELLGLQ